MLKHLALCAALLASANGSANAQQREAILQKVAVPGAAFDLVIAMPKPSGQTYDLSKSPEALIVHLVGGKLALGFDDPWKMMETVDYLRRPIGSFHVDSPDRKTQIPIAVYMVTAGE